MVILALACSLLGPGASVDAAAAATATPRVIGGEVVAASKVPWVVALLHTSVANAYNAQECGGSLISPEWVLTAAHCVTKETAGSMDVTFGITNLNRVRARDRHALAQIIVNPHYNSKKNIFDVALLRLASPVANAATIGLNTNASTPHIGAALAAYGWGSTGFPTLSYPAKLHGVTVSDLAGPSGACGNYPHGKYISKHMLCAGVPGGGKDTCFGDSGGPLVEDTAAGPRVAGVTSWGRGCARNHFPGAYARVSTYAAWITTTMKSALKT